ncbi:hypothetical protein SESBI_11700 [Sesbania bispinosa]|nr:hypothetical protein SESBI_11700 [Sesbania bispinosa]
MEPQLLRVFLPRKRTCLDRSTRKPKVVDQCSLGGGFQKTIGMELERKTVSYKDICIGVNGHNLSEEDADLFEEGPSREEGEHSGEEANSGFMEILSA